MSTWNDIHNFWQHYNPLLFTVIGGLTLMAMIAAALRKIRATKWPTVEGIITKSGIRLDRSGKVHCYFVDVLYQFEISGETHHGREITGSESGSSSDHYAKQLASKYPVGAEIKVYYNPEKPKDCLLEPGLRGSDLVWMLAPLLFMGVGIGIFVSKGM